MSDRRHVEYPPCARPAVGFTQVSSQDTLLPLPAPPSFPHLAAGPRAPFNTWIPGSKGIQSFAHTEPAFEFLLCPPH